MSMLDGKAVGGTIVAMMAAGSTWLEQANAYGQLALTVGGIIVVCLTAWYTWERAHKLKNERKEQEKK